MKSLSVALVDLVDTKRVDYFDHHAKNIITFTLWEHLAAIGRAKPGLFIPNPSWGHRKRHIQPQDVVIYFLLDQSKSIAREFQTHPTVSTPAGFTTQTPRGVLCEVYVEGNMPAGRLGNVAFHELMHCKLDVGGSVFKDLHEFNPIRAGKQKDQSHEQDKGLANLGTGEGSVLNSREIRLLTKHILRPIPQYTDAMAL